MADDVPEGEGMVDETTPKVTIPNAINDSSLETLANELGQSNGITFCMLLNIPNTKIIRYKSKCEKNPSPGATPPSPQTIAGLLKYWRNDMREHSKDKEKINDIVRAFNQWGKLEWAERFLSKHRDNEEITKGTFADLREADLAKEQEAFEAMMNGAPTITSEL